MLYTFTVAVIGLLMMFVFFVADKPLIVFVAAFLTVYLIYRRAQKRNKEYLAAVEEISKEAMPELYAIVKEKTKHLR